MIDVTAKTAFVHGYLSMTKGETAAIPEAMAKDLEAAGLVGIGAAEATEKMAPQPENKMARQPRTKGK